VRRRLRWALLAAGWLLFGACHQAAAALDWIHVGPRPGDVPAGTTLVLVSAVIVLIGSGFGLIWATIRNIPVEGAVAIPVAAAALAVARFFSFDANVAPTRRRISESSGGGSVALVIATAAVAVAATLASRRFGRGGLAAGAAACWLAGLTITVLGAGR
jgi:hypothetical protein